MSKGQSGRGGVEGLWAVVRREGAGVRESCLHLTRCCVEPGFQEAREEAAVVSAAVVMTCSRGLTVRLGGSGEAVG